MSIEIELRFPTVAYGYAGVKVSGNSAAEVEATLAANQKNIGLAIQIAGGGDSHAQAERLLREELGAVKINEDGSPWDEPPASVAQPWGPPVESAGPPPFGAPASAASGGSPTNAFGAPVVTMGRSPVIKNMPRVPEWDKANWQNPQSPEGQQVKAIKDYCYKAGSKVKWDAARSGFGFEKPPTQELLAYLRANLASVGASLEE